MGEIEDLGPRQRHRDVEEICSPGSVAIDTAHGYVVWKAAAGDWQDASPVNGLAEMDHPIHRILREEYSKPARTWVHRIEEGPSRVTVGYEYLGKRYLRRGPWNSGTLTFAHSDDQKLMILAAADSRGMPPPDKALFRNPSNNGAYGRFGLDIFYEGPEAKIAALDIDCDTNVVDSLSHVSLINSRWVAIGLDRHLQKMLLFDFRERAGK